MDQSLKSKAPNIHHSVLSSIGKQKVFAQNRNFRQKPESREKQCLDAFYNGRPYLEQTLKILREEISIGVFLSN